MRRSKKMYGSCLRLSMAGKLESRKYKERQNNTESNSCDLEEEHEEKQAQEGESMVS